MHLGLVTAIIVFSSHFLLSKQANAQNEFVVDLKVERSDGTAITDAEITAYRNSKRLDQKKQQTDNDGVYRFKLPVGDPVELKIEYVKELNKKYWPHVVWSVSGRKQSNNGLIPVVLTTTTETKTAPGFVSATGHLEGAARLTINSREFIDKGAAYETYLDSLTGLWASEAIKKGISETTEEYAAYGDKLNYLAAQFRRESPVISSGTMSFQVVKSPRGLGKLPYYPELVSHTMFSPWATGGWVDSKGPTEFTVFQLGFNKKSPLNYCASLALDGSTNFFHLDDGKIALWNLVGDEVKKETVADVKTSKMLFSANYGALVGNLTETGSLEFHRKELNTWKVFKEIPQIPPFDSWAFSLDGRLFATASGIISNGRITVFDMVKGSQLLSLQIPEGASGIAFNSTGTALYIAIRSQGVIRKYNLDSRSYAEHIEKVESLLGPIGWKPIENKLFVPTVNGAIKVISGF